MQELVKFCTTHGWLTLEQSRVREKSYKSNITIYLTCRLCVAQKKRKYPKQDNSKLIENYKINGKKCKTHGKLSFNELIMPTGYCKYCRQETVNRSNRKLQEKFPPPYISLLKEEKIFCNYCENHLDFDKFTRLTLAKRFPVCMSCYPKIERVPRYSKLKNNELRLSVKIRLMSAFGMTDNDYKCLLEKQNNSCAICKRSEQGLSNSRTHIKRLSVDHDHKVEDDRIIKIRGLLCQNCNQGLGAFKDDENILLNAIEYLKNDPVLTRVMRPKQKSDIPNRLKDNYKNKLRQKKDLKNILEGSK